MLIKEMTVIFFRPIPQTSRIARPPDQRIRLAGWTSDKHPWFAGAGYLSNTRMKLRIIGRYAQLELPRFLLRGFPLLARRLGPRSFLPSGYIVVVTRRGVSRRKLAEESAKPKRSGRALAPSASSTLCPSTRSS